MDFFILAINLKTSRSFCRRTYFYAISVTDHLKCKLSLVVYSLILLVTNSFLIPTLVLTENT